MIAIRKHTTVDKDHRIEVTVEDLPHGAEVGVIVLAERKEPTPQDFDTFWNAVASISIDAPEDYFVTYERALYGNLGANA